MIINYKVAGTSRSFGNDVFSSLVYAHNHPRCTMERYEEGALVATQVFNKVTIEDHPTEKGHKRVIAFVQRDGKEQPIDMTIDSKYLAI